MVFIELYNVSNRHNFQVNWIVTTMSFQFSNLCTIALNDENLKFRGMTLTYFEMMFLNTHDFLLAYIRLAIGLIFKLIGSLQLWRFNFRAYALLH